jgi:hypothetical protein
MADESEELKEPQRGDMEWVHCNECRRKTRHEVVVVRKLKTQEDVDVGYWIDWVTTYTMLECRGCGSVSLRSRLVSEDIDVDETAYYPPPISRQIPRWHYELPNSMRDLLKECYAALQAGSERLAIMGARSVVDVFMNNTIGDIGGFQQKLDELVKQGYVSKQNRDTLEAALEAGHAVVHRGHSPKGDEVALVFDIVENMLQTLVLKEKSEKLKEKTPKRGKCEERVKGDDG